jgi:lipoyl-dependent peroxiredoxin
MDRKATAQWKGNLKSGAGTISTASGTLANAQYSFKTRFEQGVGTNPEELLAAAHAGCFSMALSLILQEKGLDAETIDTTCTISLDKEGDGFAIKRSHLELKAKVPGASEDVFRQATIAAKEGCPVSKLFDTEITLDAQLVS